MAAALRRRGHRRSAQGQDACAGQAAGADGNGGEGSRHHLLGAAGRGHALDRTRSRQARRPVPAHHPADLGGSSSATASHTDLQALERSCFRREGRGHRRPLHEPAGARRRTFDRREEPDPGAEPDPAQDAGRAGQARNHDARLQASWDDHALCGAQRPRRQRHRSLHAAPPSPGVHPLPQRRGGERTGGQGDPCGARQLCRPQASARSRLARAKPALDLPLHADIRFMDERRRRLLLRPDPKASETRRIRLHNRSSGCHQALHHRAQQCAKAVRLDKAGRRHHGKNQSSA